VIVGDSVIAENLYYFLPAKSLNLPHVKISQKVTPTHRGYLIHLTADKLAKNVFLYSDLEGRFTENYFDLIPDESKAIEFTTLTNEPDFEKRLKIISLVNAY
jgi:beta-mannosidase